MPVIEWVVNVSEGRNEALLSELASVISAHEGCYLLHRDTGYGAHRTVFTVAGELEAVLAAAYDFFALAKRRIDMRKHQGEHPRIGAVDVSPFIPIDGISLEALAERTHTFGHKIGEELCVSGYFYEASALSSGRRNLADIRRGQYEGLAEKMSDPLWRPDFGPHDFDPAFGACVVGARPFLIAWNINLAEDCDVSTSKYLSSCVRAKNGGFEGLKAIGWYIPEFGRCQVSCNVVDPDKVNLLDVYRTVSRLAEEKGTRVTGSELIGLIPEKYLRRAGKDTRFETRDARTVEIERAVKTLGLADLAPFDWRERVLEEVIGGLGE